MHMILKEEADFKKWRCCNALWSSTHQLHIRRSKQEEASREKGVKMKEVGESGWSKIERV